MFHWPGLTSQLAIQYHKEMELMIPCGEVEQYQELIAKALKEADPTSTIISRTD